MIDELKHLESDIRYRIDTFARPDDPTETKPLLATMVRLLFHDCAASTVNLQSMTLPKGKCNGCINPNNNEHSGLEYGAIYPLEQVYINQNTITTYDNTLYSGISYLQSNTQWVNPSGINWSTKLSRADFWAISATLAIEYGIKLAYQDSISPTSALTTNSGRLQAIEGWQLVHGIRYFEGRTDCDTSPWESHTNVIFKTNPNWEFSNLKTFFQKQLGFKTNREVLAIMGAHTLGRGHNNIERDQIDMTTNCCGGTGYFGKWKARASHTFTYEYYQDIYFMRWKQVPANQRMNGSIIPNGSSILQFKFFKDSAEYSNTHDGLMLNIDQTLIFQPGLNISNFTTGQVGCDVWELGCADPVNNCDGSFYGIETPCTRFTFPPVENIDPYFESYHLFDTGFYRDFGMVWDKMITVNEAYLKYYVERIRPLYTYAGKKNTKNGVYEITKEWYADLNNLQIWSLNDECQLIRFNDSFISANNLQYNPFNGELNPNSGYIVVYVTRDMQFENGYYNPKYAGSETYDIYKWFGTNVDENGVNANVWDQLNDYARAMRNYIEDTYDQVDVGYDEQFMNLNTENQGTESIEFKNLFGSEVTLSYDNTELTPVCGTYLIPIVDDYIIQTNGTINASYSPIKSPTDQPTFSPSFNPSASPIKSPTDQPTFSPTNNPAKTPTSNPISAPTRHPTHIPSFNPTFSPTNNPITPGTPTNTPSLSTDNPTNNPTLSPSNQPSTTPSNNPTVIPSNNPSLIPTNNPTIRPTGSPHTPGTPSKAPSNITPLPSINPSLNPSNIPTISPTNNPIIATQSNTINTTNNPSNIPTINECDNDCDDEYDNQKKIKVKIRFWFPQWIVYDFTYFKCWLYKIFITWFNNFEFIKYFDICDIEIIVIGGHANTDNNICTYKPCILNHNKQRRILLQNNINDGNVSLEIISNDKDTMNAINELSLDSMSNQLYWEFHHKFEVNMKVNIQVMNEKNDNENSVNILNISSYSVVELIIGGVVLFVIIVFIILLIIVCCKRCKQRRQVYTSRGDIITTEMMTTKRASLNVGQKNIITTDDDDEYDNDTVFNTLDVDQIHHLN